MIKFKGLVSHEEFAGSNSCWRPFFGTNRLDDDDLSMIWKVFTIRHIFN